MSPTFLTLESVAAIHPMQLDEFGGSPSAANTLAAAYLFHIVQNHPFVDGN